MKFSNPTLVTITAPTCAGKTYLLERLIEKGFERIVSTTTRPPRVGEVQGVDYYFIDDSQSKILEESGAFAELVTLRGRSGICVRYGVTVLEMREKMAGPFAPIVIVEPRGVNMYEEYCRKNGWDIFKVFVSTPENVRIKRLNARTAKELEELDDATMTELRENIAKVIQTHTDRLLSITGDERLWQAQNSWDAIVPGDNHEKALSFIEQGIKWRNSQKDQPKA